MTLAFRRLLMVIKHTPYEMYLQVRESKQAWTLRPKEMNLGFIPLSRPALTTVPHPMSALGGRQVLTTTNRLYFAVQMGTA